MTLIGYLISFVGLYFLYAGELVFGAIVFTLGGMLARKMFLCLRSLGVLMMVVGIAYGFHYGYSPFVLFVIFIGFVLACFNRSRSTRDQDDGWGFEFDLSSLNSDSSDGGSDGGGGD